ncbi:MAG: NADH-quinone oxidoreductase subunit N [bacterium]
MAELNINFWSIAPQLILITFGFLLLLLGALAGKKKTGMPAYVSVFGLIIAFAVNGYLFGLRKLAFSNMLLFDELTAFFNFIFIGVGIVVSLLSNSYIKERIKYECEFYALILFSISGMSFLVSSLDFIILFLGLELMSFSVYILAAMFKNDEKSTEGALKYFLLGSFSTAFLLLGIAFLYGNFGTTNYAFMLQHFAKFSGEKALILSVASGLVLAGIVFKIAAVPFHMWTPDAYEGAPTTVTAFMATAVKAAAFAMLLRVYLLGLRPLIFDAVGIVAILSVLTMTLGNLSALAQKNVKRMLAYSSIAHAGYILVGFVSLTQTGLSAILFYLVSYALMNLGAFGVIMLFESNLKSAELSDLAGKGFKYPFLGFLMVVFMFSLAGVPPTAGFSGKFYIFTSAVQANYISLAIIGVLNSAVSAYYYLRVLIYLYFKEYDGGISPSKVTPSTAVAMVLMVIGVLTFGVLPQKLFELTVRSVSYLF